MNAASLFCSKDIKVLFCQLLLNMSTASTYSGSFLARWDEKSCNTYTAAGNASSMINGQISYMLHLTGDSVSIDTACASALSATKFVSSCLLEGRAAGISVGAMACHWIVDVGDCMAVQRTFFKTLMCHLMEL